MKPESAMVLSSALLFGVPTIVGMAFAWTGHEGLAVAFLAPGPFVTGYIVFWVWHRILERSTGGEAPCPS